MNDPDIEQLNLLDTEYIDILTNSRQPNFELQLIQLGINPPEARVSTDLIALLKNQPSTPEEWEEFLAVYEKACGYRPTPKEIEFLSKLLWTDDSDESSGG